MPSRIISTIALVALGLSSLTSAHTWIEQMMVIAPNGSMVGSPGYARGNVLRSDPGFSDPTMVNLIPPNGRTINTILDSDLMCKSTQTTESQTNNSPRLQAAPGSSIALRYQENGHVTLPENQPGKPDNRGTVYVYGTTSPSPTDSLLGIHRVWTADGSGGDKRGVLLSTQNFDDGQCYQVNGGPISAQRQAQFAHVATPLMGGDLWCQQDIALPTEASGTYTLYWVWDWPTLPGTAGFPDGKQEIYTTCMDVDVSGSADSQSASFAAGQSLDTAAISSELADITNPTAVTGQTIAFSSVSGAAATAAASAISGTSTEFSITTDASGGHSIISASTAAVVPVAASATPSASSLAIFPTSSSSPAATASAPATTDSGHHHGLAGATFTDWASVTMTVFQTVFNKRDLGKSTSHTALPRHHFHNIGAEVANASPSVIQTAPAPKPACSGSSTYTLRGRFYIPPANGKEC